MSTVGLILPRSAKALPLRGTPPRRLQGTRRHPISLPGAGPLNVVSHAAGREGKMNYLRTAILLAGLTALFMGVGYLIGGQNGALIALLVAGAMNFFAYWRSDSMVLSM